MGETVLKIAEQLPTPLAGVVRRVEVARADGGAQLFLNTSYVAEAAIKLLGIALQAGLRAKAPEQAYRMGYELVRADGLGSWEAWIRTATSQPLAGFLPVTYNDLTAWAGKARSKPEDQWFRDAVKSIEVAFSELGLSSSIPDRKPTIRDFIAALVQLRNKTKAHGAVGADYFDTINKSFVDAIERFVVSCPLHSWKWLHLSPRPNGKNRGIHLLGNNPGDMRQAEIAPLELRDSGVYIWPPASVHPIYLGTLLTSNRECTEFLLPNGGAREATAQFIDYATGRTVDTGISAFLRRPAPLPSSETHGLEVLDVQSNIFGNLPPLPQGYVRRTTLEAELEKRLRDRNHPIITLHGRGGIGKTSLALRAAHKLAAERDPLFEYIVWFSARDIDLKPSGPRDVRPAVISLERVAAVFGTLFETESTVEAFAATLQASTTASQKGVLFIFDNFETMEELRSLQEFLDTHTHLPNKVLITSRERAFKADFPIEVRGMEWPEAEQLMREAGTSLGIDSLVTSDVISGIYEYSEGHPYVIRVILGEIAKEGRFVAPKSLLPRRLDIIDAVFERSFSKLSASGRRVFLTVGLWKSVVSELALLIVLGQHELDVEEGIDECLRLSLIERRLFLDEQPGYVAPQLARVFARKKVEGDPDRPLIQSDLSLLQKFGVIPTAQPVQVPQYEYIMRFIESCLATVPAKQEEYERLDGILARLAEIWPDAWIALASFRRKGNSDREGIEYALRRAVEERPSSKEAHILRAQYALEVQDEATFIASRLRAVEVDPDDLYLLREVAFDVCKYLNDHTRDIPIARRGVYIAGLREQMEKVAASLDATGLSRLAWLYLLEEDTPNAERVARVGLAKEPGNVHCQRIVERLRQRS